MLLEESAASRSLIAASETLQGFIRVSLSSQRQRGNRCSRFLSKVSAGRETSHQSPISTLGKTAIGIIAIKKIPTVEFQPTFDGCGVLAASQRNKPMNGRMKFNGGACAFAPWSWRIACSSYVRIQRDISHRVLFHDALSSSGCAT